MPKTIQIPEDVYNYLVRKTRGKESFGETLRRLLRINAGNRKPHPTITAAPPAGQGEANKPGAL